MSDGTKIRVPGIRLPCRTRPINDPGANFLSPGLRILTNIKKNPKTMKVRKGRPVETAAAVEIDSGGLRQLFLDDSHRCLKKPMQKPLRLFHSYAQARWPMINNKSKENRREPHENAFLV